LLLAQSRIVDFRVWETLLANTVTEATQQP